MSKILAICGLLIFLGGSARADALDSALSVIGRTRTDFRVDPEIMSVRPAGDLKLPIFDQWFAHPLRAPFFERHLRNAMLDSRGELHPLWSSAAGMLGVTTRRALIPPSPLLEYAERAKQEDALKSAIHALDSEAHVPSTESAAGGLAGDRGDAAAGGS